MKTPTKAKQASPKGPPRSRKLNVRQERFCENIVSGMSGTDAWIAAGYNVDRETARKNASESQTKPDITARIAELRKPQTEKAVLTKDIKREILRQIAMNPKEPTAVRIKAIEVDAKLAGDFAPDKVEVETGGQLADIMARAANAVSVLSRIGRKTTARPTTCSGLSRIGRDITRAGA